MVKVYVYNADKEYADKYNGYYDESGNYHNNEYYWDKDGILHKTGEADKTRSSQWKLKKKRLTRNPGSLYSISDKELPIYQRKDNTWRHVTGKPKDDGFVLMVNKNTFLYDWIYDTLQYKLDPKVADILPTYIINIEEYNELTFNFFYKLEMLIFDQFKNFEDRPVIRVEFEINQDIEIMPCDDDEHEVEFSTSFRTLKVFIEFKLQFRPRMGSAYVPVAHIKVYDVDTKELVLNKREYFHIVIIGDIKGYKTSEIIHTKKNTSYMIMERIIKKYGIDVNIDDLNSIHIDSMGNMVIIDTTNTKIEDTSLLSKLLG